MFNFKDNQEFTQEAFNHIARIVFEHGKGVLDCSVPAIPTENCLSHLAFVAKEYAYDNSRIEVYAQNYHEYNQEMIAYFGEF